MSPADVLVSAALAYFAYRACQGFVEFYRNHREEARHG